MENLNDDLTGEAMRNLDLKELLRFKSVNKRYYRLISENSFVKLYNLRNRSNCWLFSLFDGVLHGLRIEDGGLGGHIAFELRRFPNLCRKRHHVQLLTATGNLFLVHVIPLFDAQNSELYVLNPFEGRLYAIDGHYIRSYDFYNYGRNLCDTNIVIDENGDWLIRFTLQAHNAVICFQYHHVDGGVEVVNRDDDDGGVEMVNGGDDDGDDGDGDDDDDIDDDDDDDDEQEVSEPLIGPPPEVLAQFSTLIDRQPSWAAWLPKFSDHLVNLNGETTRIVITRRGTYCRVVCFLNRSCMVRDGMREVIMQQLGAGNHTIHCRGSGIWFIAAVSGVFGHGMRALHSLLVYKLNRNGNLELETLHNIVGHELLQVRRIIYLAVSDIEDRLYVCVMVGRDNMGLQKVFSYDMLLGTWRKVDRGQLNLAEDATMAFTNRLTLPWPRRN